ncbi:unnamed protein product [Penicillium salamii]|nr:unnamed protein product [Penicillium salamii]CAG8384546.1 unnamed protein product [Penicillium salamii]
MSCETHRSTSPLELLPNELLDQIISYLFTDPPSLGKLHHAPSLELTHSPTKDLKHLASCSSRLLKLVQPLLFSHVYLDLHEEAEFHAFTTKSGLGRHITSLVVLGEDKPGCPNDPFWWRRVLQYIDPDEVVVIAPPPFLGSTMGTPIMNAHSWAFEIELQILALKQESKRMVSSQLPGLESCPSLLASREWKSMSFNESSSLKSYHHYEYFLSTVPSILGEWGANSIRVARHLPQYRADLLDLLHGLTHFSYTAVFPFFNHSQLVLDAVMEMHNLQRLDVRLAPCPGNHVTEVEQRGPMDLSDPWMELSTSYSLVGYTVNKMENLKEFRCNDLHVEGMRDELLATLGDVIDGEAWTHNGNGIWRRL